MVAVNTRSTNLRRTLRPLGCELSQKAFPIFHCVELRRRSASCQMKPCARPPLPYLHPPNPSSLPSNHTRSTPKRQTMWQGDNGFSGFTFRLSSSECLQQQCNSESPTTRLETARKFSSRALSNNHRASWIETNSPRFASLWDPSNWGGWQMQQDN